MTERARVSALVPWRDQRIEVDPPEGYWAFNPSIVRMPDDRLLCAVRCANYHRTMGLRLPSAITNRNFILELDPITLRIAKSIEIEDCDSRPKMPSRIVGHDDLRLAWTKRDGLVAIANTAHYSANGHKRDMVVLDLDARYRIVSSTPLQGAWTGHQKNWSPFVGTSELLLAYSVERGGLHTRDGRIAHLHGLDRMGLRGGSQLVPLGPNRWLGIAHGVDDHRSAHRNDAKPSGARRVYWHVWYVTDDRARIFGLSRPFKLCDAPIEFAAGLTIDPDTGRVIVSYGVEDDHAMLGITELDAVLATIDARTDALLAQFMSARVRENA